MTWKWDAVACNLCGVRDEQVLGKRGGQAHWAGAGEEATVVRCRRCGLIYPNPMPKPAESDIYSNPDEYFRQHVEAKKVESYEHVIAEAEELLGTTGHLLDVGCGRGEALAAAMGRGWEATGVETSAEFAQYARTHHGANVVVGELTTLALPAGKYDAVLLGAVLEHVFDPLGLLREIRRVIAPGGVLWIDVPNEGGLYFKIGNLVQRLRGRDWVINLAPTFEPFHVHGFSPRTLRRALELADFRVERMTTPRAQAVSRARGIRRLMQLWAAELVDRCGALVSSGSYLDAWARAAADSENGATRSGPT